MKGKKDKQRCPLLSEGDNSTKKPGKVDFVSIICPTVEISKIKNFTRLTVTCYC